MVTPHRGSVRKRLVALSKNLHYRFDSDPETEQLHDMLDRMEILVDTMHARRGPAPAPHRERARLAEARRLEKLTVFDKELDKLKKRAGLEPHQHFADVELPDDWRNTLNAADMTALATAAGGKVKTKGEAQTVLKAVETAKASRAP